MFQPSILHDVDTFLRSPGGVYVAVVGLLAYCGLLWWIVAPWCERLIDRLGLNEAPTRTLSAIPQQPEGENRSATGPGETVAPCQFGLKAAVEYPNKAALQACEPGAKDPSFNPIRAAGPSSRLTLLWPDREGAAPSPADTEHFDESRGVDGDNIPRLCGEDEHARTDYGLRLDGPSHRLRGLRGPNLASRSLAGSEPAEAHTYFIVGYPFGPVGIRRKS